MFLKSFTFAAAVLLAMPAMATDPKAVSQEDGKYLDADGNPTYNIQADGTVDWFTYSGFRMYHAECHVCHGPDAMGSTYAPALKDSLHEKNIDYYKFMEIVSSGQKNTAMAGGSQSVMPAFGTNLNVMCYIDDLYVYIRARADGALDRGRPAKKEAKPEAVRKANMECLGES
jgi:methanol metabolism-related c-type cytochrome